eukprot:TRINITY_DN50598_c0_g1_i1.p1 TRINITY_DN50598_c0_g1~~TRINITY_DN50598_c0_g1_i1.p1  ORF type:complete len:315 (+),score=56.35 TRINITY_DN50598_c0_g1_i1:204-1148(+)
MALEVRNNQDPDAFYRLCLERPGGLSTDDLAGLGWNDQAAIMRAANVLLGQGKVKLTQLAQDKFIYTAVDPALAAKFRGLTEQDLLVYQLVQKTGDKGAWSKVIKDQSALQQHTITKVTKELMRRQLIKEVKSVQNRNRKVFMAWDVEPAREVSGGTWYRDGEFAAGWIETLRSRCLEYVERNMGRSVTLQDIHFFVQEQPTGPSVPTEEDIACILRSLELDEAIYAEQTSEGMKIYTHRSQTPDVFSGRMPGVMLRHQPVRYHLTVPCLQCPFIDECRPGGRICPEKCDYIGHWLKGANADDGGGTDQPLGDW